jgi:hypothetical protein
MSLSVNRRFLACGKCVYAEPGLMSFIFCGTGGSKGSKPLVSGPWLSECVSNLSKRAA